MGFSVIFTLTSIRDEAELEGKLCSRPPFHVLHDRYGYNTRFSKTTPKRIIITIKSNFFLYIRIYTRRTKAFSFESV